MPPSRLDVTCRQRAYRRLAAIHHDEMADLLASERIKAGLPAQADHHSAHCGTRSGYEAHRRRGGKPCEPCRQANAEYHRARAAS